MTVTAVARSEIVKSTGIVIIISLGDLRRAVGIFNGLRIVLVLVSKEQRTVRQIDQCRHLKRQRTRLLSLLQTFLQIRQRCVIPLAVIKHDSVAQVDHRRKHMIARAFNLFCGEKQIIGPIRLVPRFVVLADDRPKIIRLRLTVPVAIFQEIINPDIHHPLVNPWLVGVVLRECPQQTIRGIEIAAGGLRI